MTKPLEALIADMKAAADKASTDGWGYDVDEFHSVATHENVLTLIAALEQARNHISRQEDIMLNQNQKISDLESSETQLIDERDSAEEALADMYQAATGDRPEWSNHFGFTDAVEAVEQRLGELEASKLTVNLPEKVPVYADDGIQQMLINNTHNAAIDACAEVIRAAGGTVGGAE